MAQGPSSRGPESPRASEESPRATSAAAPPQSDVDEDLTLERTLGEFRILRRLGRGGMAEVFLAEQTSLKRNVAVKVLREDRPSDETHLKRFKTEAMAAAALSHPNIVQVYTIGDHEGTHYIAQEYVQGLNLREYVTRKGPPEMQVALHIMKQVAGALQAAHAAGIVHRDIKPENIMLTRRGDVKVADFGLAQLAHDTEGVNLTQVGVTMGTPLYMSPEQVSGRKLDPRSDLYSLGVTCYHMLTGAPPFRGQTALAVAVQHLKQDPDPLENVRGDLPAALCRIVHKMMAKNVEKRYQSAQEVLKDLKRISQGDGAGPGVAEVEPEPDLPENDERTGVSVWKRAGARVWRLPDRPLAAQAWVFLLVALLTGAASAGIGWLTRERDPFLTPAAADPVPDMGSVAKQYLHALNLRNDEAAWQAVIDYPAERKDTLFKNSAREQLAMYYLANRRYDEAETLFNGLASDAESQWRAFGLAGQAFILHHRGNFPESQRVIERVNPALYEKLDGRMKLLFNDTVRRNYDRLDKQLDDQWRNLFDKPQPDSGPLRDNG
jgi:serine/threonine-protein kinase